MVAANQPATGAPLITGNAAGGPDADRGPPATIADPDGITRRHPDAISYQWVRVDGANETDIPGATGTTYTPVDDDVGKTIKVKASFTDDAGNRRGGSPAKRPRR